MYKTIMILVALLLTTTFVFSQDGLNHSDFDLLKQSKVSTLSLLDRIEKLEKSLDKPQEVWYPWSYRDAAKLCWETGRPFIICKGCGCKDGVCKDVNEVCRRYGEQGKKVVCVDGDPYYNDIPDGEYEVIKVNGELQYSKPVYKKTYASTPVYRQPIYQYSMPMYQYSMPVYQGGFTGGSCGPSG